MWTQIVGKVRMALTPLVNHWWNVTLVVSARGLTTAAMPCGDRWLDMEMDFLDHLLVIRASDGEVRRVPLRSQPVSAFYAETMSSLAAMNIRPHLSPHPAEVEGFPPFDEDHQARPYDPEYAQRFWRVLAHSTGVLQAFRAEFIGKCSPVHFFWGGFDLAVTRFSGRPAPARPGADPMSREAYSHEVSSVGWWPGDARLPEPAYYSYAAPEPEGFGTSPVLPREAYYDPEVGFFYLPYDTVRSAPDPRRLLLDFCRTTYAAAADRGGWDRAALERAPRPS
jgi:hypothetical protein